MTSEADDAQARRDARWAQYQAQSRRSMAKLYIGLAVLWVTLAVLWWLNGDADTVARWLNSAVAVGWVGLAVLHWWKFLRQPPSRE